MEQGIRNMKQMCSAAHQAIKVEIEYLDMLKLKYENCINPKEKEFYRTEIQHTQFGIQELRRLIKEEC